jgi:hypothetical protein
MIDMEKAVGLQKIVAFYEQAGIAFALQQYLDASRWEELARVERRKLDRMT